MPATPRLALTYFPFPGRAGAIRDTLRIGRIPFEDRHVTRDQHFEAKAKGEWPWGALPVLDIDGERVCQSNAILRYAGKLAGLYPTEPVAALKVDEALDACDELVTSMSMSIREEDAGRRAAMRKTMAEETLPRDFARFEKMIDKQGSGWLAGPDMTIADLRVLHQVDKLTDGSLDGIPPSVIEPFAKLKAWRERVRAERGRRLAEPAAAEAS
jgi:glutathione S-transferase